ncbi:putative exported protein [Pseudomonas fluorescens]|nr:putative exported protein [Pseudomonas fluorescens]
MSRMATRLRTVSFATVLGLCASSAFAQSPAEFINDASAKGMADIEASRLAHGKTESKEVKDYTIVVINDRTTANQHLAKIARKLDLPVAPREEIADKAKELMPEVKDGATFDQAYAASQVKATEEAITQIEQQAKTTDVPEIKAFADETLPKLQSHLEKARALQASR